MDTTRLERATGLLVGTCSIQLSYVSKSVGYGFLPNERPERATPEPPIGILTNCSCSTSWTGFTALAGESPEVANLRLDKLKGGTL